MRCSTKHSVGVAPLDASDLLRPAKQLEVRAREVDAPPGRLKRQPLPAIAQGKDGAFFCCSKSPTTRRWCFIPTPTNPRLRRLTSSPSIMPAPHFDDDA